MKVLMTAMLVGLTQICCDGITAAGGLPQRTSITVTIDHPVSSVVVVEVRPVTLKTRPAVPDQRKIVLKENTGRVNLSLEGPAQIKIMNVWKDSSIYYMVMPGIDFYIHLDTHRRNFRKTGKVGEEENRFHHFLLSQTESRLKRIAWEDPVGFIEQWKYLSDTLNQIVDSALASGLNSFYIEWNRSNLRSMLQTALRQQLVSYVTVRGLWPANLKEYQAQAITFTETQLNDPAFFTADGDKDLISAYYLFPALMQYYDNDSRRSPSLEAVYTSALKEALRIRSAEIRSLMLDYLVVNAVSQTNDPAFLRSLPPFFLKTPKEKYLKDLIQAKLRLLQSAAVGQPAPFFIAGDPESGPFSYSDYAGTFLYIDIWATWCHPCVAQFPYMEKLKEKYAGKPITFVSVSIDSENTLWRRFLEDRELVGGQFHSDPGIPNSIRDVYLARLIPAFILIGPEGDIISPSCYRPSDPAIGMLLDRLLQ